MKKQKTVPKELTHIEKVNAFIPAAIAVAKQKSAHGAYAKRGKDADEFSSLFHLEMNRLTVGAGLRAP